MKGSLIIVSFFVLGIIVGLCDVIPAGLLDSDVSYCALCCLMFCVGISIGCDTSVLKSFKKVNPRLMMLPVMTILGTLAGCAAVSLILSHRQFTDCLAIGSGFGYYSLEYLHHRIQGRRTGNHRPSCQHLPRDSHPVVCSAAGKILRQTGTYQCRWSYDHGYNVANHHPIFGREFHHRFHLPWFLCRLFCTLPGYLLLFFVEITKSSFKPNPYETYFQFIHDMSEPVLCPYLSSPCGSERLYAVCLFQRASVVPEPYEGIFHDFFGIPLKSI